MRIAHVHHRYIPKRGYQENILPHEQQERGHEVKIFTSDRTPEYRDGSTFEPGVYDYGGVETERLPTVLEISLTDGVVLSGLGDALKEFDPDIVHGHNTLGPYVLQAALYCRLHHCPLVVDDHVDDDNFSTRGIKRKTAFAVFKNLLFPFISRTTKTFIATHRFSRVFLTHTLDIPDSHVETLPLGTDTDVFYPDSDLREWKRLELGLEDDASLVVTSGYFEPQKRLKTVVDAVAAVSERFEDVQLLFAGDGPEEYMSQIESRVEEQGITDATTFTGYVSQEELNALYNAADIGVWPGIGITIREAMATGLPIVVGENVTTFDLVKNANGLLFPSNDRVELTDRLETYLSDEDFRRQHADRTRELVDREFAWKRVAKQSVELYRDVIEGEPSEG